MSELPFGDFLGALSSKQARFIHMNQDEGPGNVYPFGQLGCDNYENAPGTMMNPAYIFWA